MNLNLLLIITAVILLCMVVDGYKKGMVRSLISLISLLITCVVLFLLGNALSSYFDGRFFNVIITLLLLAAIGLVHHLLNVVFFSAKVISKLPIVHSLDKLLGIVVGILETILIVWTIYAFNIFRDLGTLGQVIVDYTRDSRILTCLYENNYLAYLVEQLGQKLPFFVKTKDLQLQVLGTKFNFRDYPEDHEVVVSLLEGKVELNNLLKKEKEAVLAPDERAILNKTNGLMTVETVTASNASQWTGGYLFFDEELLPDIVKELERSYNVTIRIANDSLNTFRFYGNFVRREQSIQEVLEALASTEKIQYKIEERNITIY